MRRFLTTEFTVGTFALLGLLIIIYMSLQINDRGTVGGSANSYRAYFQSVSGLVRKVPVEVSGIPAGFIQSIDLVDGRARVIVRVRKDVKVYANSSLSVRDRGILGDRFLMLNPGTPDAALLGDGDEIPKTFSQGDLERLTSSLAETADLVKSLVESDNPKGALGQVIVNLRDTTKQIKDMVGENEGRFNRIMANVDSFTSDLKDITGENKDDIHNVLVSMSDTLSSLKEVLGKDGSFRKAADNLDSTMASLQRVADKIDKGEGTIGKLVNDETTVNNLNQAIDTVNDTLGVFRKIQLGIRYRGEWLTGAQELQSLIGISVAPTPDQYVMLEFVSAPVGVARVTDTVVLSNGVPVTTTQTIQTNDNLLLSLFYAKRLWDLTARVGLMRSRAGIGLDYHLLRDKFIVSFEGFDFSRDFDRAHLRAYGTLVLYKHLLFTGGVDDLITKASKKNPFFGLGIQFYDSDLKAIAASAGGAAKF